MAFTLSHALVLLLVIVGAINVTSQEQHRGAIMHAGQCPSSNLLIHIHCRRRVCLPGETTPLCKDDGGCAETQKCCRPMCSCRNRCVDAVFEQS